MTLKIKTNLYSGILAILFAIFISVLLPSQVPIYSEMKNGVDAQFFIKLMLINLFVCGSVLIFRSVVQKKETIKDIDISSEKKPLVFFLLIVIYALLIPAVGFYLASILMNLATLLYLRTKKFSIYITNILFITSVYFIFVLLFKINLPKLGGII